MVGALFGGLTSGCSRTLVTGKVIYAFEWTPEAGEDVTLALADSSVTVGDFITKSGEQRCDPPTATSATMEVEGGITSFDSHALNHVQGAGWTAPSSPPRLRNDVQHANLDLHDTGVELSLSHTTGTAPGTVRFVFEVTTFCGQVWK